MKNSFLLCFLAIASSFALVACDNDDNNTTTNTPIKEGVVVTGDTYDLSQDKIAVQCSISQDALDNNNIKSAGVIYQQASAFVDIAGAEAELVHSASNNHRIARVGNPSAGDFRIELNDFVYGDYDYFYRAFVVIGNTYYYGKVKSVHTSSWNLNLAVGDVTKITHNSAFLNDLSFNSSTLEQKNRHYSYGIAYMSSAEFSQASLEAKTKTDVWNKASKVVLAKDENISDTKCLIDGLKPSTEYLYNPYVNVFNQSCYYGEMKKFQTMDIKIDTLITGSFDYTKVDSVLIINKNRVEASMLSKKDNYTLGVEIRPISNKDWSEAISVVAKYAELARDYSVEIRGYKPDVYIYRSFINVYDNTYYGQTDTVKIDYNINLVDFK